MRSLFVAISAVAFVTSVFAQWTENGKAVPDTPWRQSKGGFGVMLGITDRPKEFEEQWASSIRAVPVSMPSTIERNSPAQLFVIFTGCPADAAGNCDVVATLRLLKPDGSVYGELKDVDFWTGRPAPKPGSIERARHGIGFRIETSDPAGEYRVKVDIHDRVSNITFALERRFTVK